MTGVNGAPEWLAAMLRRHCLVAFHLSRSWGKAAHRHAMVKRELSAGRGPAQLSPSSHAALTKLVGGDGVRHWRHHSEERHCRAEEERCRGHRRASLKDNPRGKGERRRRASRS